MDIKQVMVLLLGIGCLLFMFSPFIYAAIEGLYHIFSGRLAYNIRYNRTPEEKEKLRKREEDTIRYHASEQREVHEENAETAMKAAMFEYSKTLDVNYEEIEALKSIEGN